MWNRILWLRIFIEVKCFEDDGKTLSLQVYIWSLYEENIFDIVFFIYIVNDKRS